MGKRMFGQITVQRLMIDRLKPAKYNPRKDLKPGDPAYEKIRRSLHDFGYVDPIVWNEVTGNIVGGHQRYKVLKPKRSEDHPTMKPIPLLAYPIKNSSAPNAVVMDLFGGSGSTLMACEQIDRICRTMELDPKYATVIVERFHMEYPDQNVTVLRDGQRLSYEEVVGGNEH